MLNGGEAMFKQKKVLIIGGTGTIGKSITKEILNHEPEVVRIFSRDEYKQFEMEQEFQDHKKDIRFLLGDVRDFSRVQRAMEDIDYVFHLAALKHVPFCEYNPFEAVQTNIIGTQNVIQAAIQSGVKKVIFTSTDKAISPTNTYGATKLTAERLVAAAEYQKGPHSTVFSAVRFGNVMGSRGSVIPLFKKQILEKQRITVTDLTMSRFMMTLKQATSLVTESAIQAQGGEIFVLKMPVVLLKDLVGVILEEMKDKHNIHDVQIHEMGVRPGEKMYEELMTEEESKGAIELPNMFVIPSPFAERDYQYQNGKHAHEGTYSSQNQAPIDREELKKLLLNEKLL